ncbi:MAG: winged helix-turn-helix transcriptional regulator [Thermoplasmata archaeon]|nr:MAG: winged helix-turn-helix transcriptional regulator [Thermoplasmata archaeon]
MDVLDDIDKRILRILLEDASMNYESIAKKVDTSVGTIHNRIKRMKEENIITKIIPAVNAHEIGYDICALIDIRIEGGHLEKVQAKFAKHENVCSVYDVTGEYDTTFVTKFRTTEELNKFVKELAGQKYVLRTSTKLVLNIVKESFIPKI